MTSTSLSWPNSGHNAGAVIGSEYEQLASPSMMSGLIGTPALPGIVYGDSTGMHVKIRANRTATVRATHYDSGPVDITLTIGANSSGSARTDLVVLRFDRADNTVYEHVLAGAPGSGAPSPVMGVGTTGYWDLPLATVSVPNGASTIAATQVLDRGWYVSGSGVSCRAAAMPPVEAGLVMSVYDLGETYVGQVNGAYTGWRLLQSYGTGWIPIPLGGGFVSGGSNWAVASCRKLDGVVYTNFGVKRTGGTLAAGRNVLLGTMPDGYKPPYTYRVPAAVDAVANTFAANCTLSTSGAITIVGYNTDIHNDDYIYLSLPSYPVI